MNSANKLNAVLVQAFQGANYNLHLDQKYEQLLLQPIRSALDDAHGSPTVFMQWKAKAYDQSFFLTEIMFCTLYLFERLVSDLVLQEELHGWKNGLGQRFNVYWSECDLTPIEKRAVVARVPEPWLEEAEAQLLFQLYPQHRQCWRALLSPYFLPDLRDSIMAYL